MIEKTIPDFLTSAEILAQTGEEAAELAQAALKLRRALTGENPTPKSIAECLDDLQEEFADVLVCIQAFCDAYDKTGSFDSNEWIETALDIVDKKADRWVQRLIEAHESTYLVYIGTEEPLVDVVCVTGATGVVDAADRAKKVYQQMHPNVDLEKILFRVECDRKEGNKNG